MGAPIALVFYKLWAQLKMVVPYTLGLGVLVGLTLSLSPPFCGHPSINFQHLNPTMSRPPFEVRWSLQVS